MAKKTGGPSEEGVANHVSGQSNKPMSKPAHALTYEEVARELGADLQNGLSNEEHKKRLEENGRNEFGETEGVQPIRIFIGQIANSLTMVSAVFSNFFFFFTLASWVLRPPAGFFSTNLRLSDPVSMGGLFCSLDSGFPI